MVVNTFLYSMSIFGEYLLERRNTADKSAGQMATERKWEGKVCAVSDLRCLISHSKCENSCFMKSWQVDSQPLCAEC
jgi:hypothetical protein